MSSLKYLLILFLCLTLTSTALAFEFSEKEWLKDGRDIIRLENVSKNMRNEMREEGAKLHDASRITSEGHEFVNSMVDKYSRLRRHFDEVRVQHEDSYLPNAKGLELKQSIKGTAMWLAATAALIENAAAMIDSFDGSIYEWRLNRPVPGKGDIQIAYMFDDMNQVLASNGTRKKIRERLALFADNMLPLNEAIIGDAEVLEELLRIVTASDEMMEDKKYSLLERAARRLESTMNRIKDWLGDRIIKGLGSFCKLLMGDPYEKGLPKKAPKMDLGQDIHDEMLTLLQPGDILVDKKTGALADYMIPGFWRHAALWIGSDEYLEKIGVYENKTNHVSSFEAREHRKQIQKGKYVLEGVFTGTCVNSLRKFTYCDAAAIFRLKESHVPIGKTREQAIEEIIKRGMYHLGQDYDFAFNVNSHHRVVCSELIYQAYPSNINWPTLGALNIMAITPDNVASMAGPTDEFPFEVIFFINQGDKHIGPTAWKAYWKSLREKGSPVQKNNPDHSQLKEAIDKLQLD